MSYIAFDLDALNVAPAVARAAGIGENDVIGGLVRLWAWCFRQETDEVTALQLRGHFGLDAGAALEAFGFLEGLAADRVPPASGPDRWRVRGASRYLRVKASQRAAAAKTNARRTGQPDGGQPTEERRSTDGPPTLDHAVSRRPTPNTDDRTPTTEREDEDPPASSPAKRAPFVRRLPIETPPDASVETGPIAYEKPSTPPETWTVDEFFAWAQYIRQNTGWVAQKRPRANLGAWFSEVLMTPGMTADRLAGAFLAFGTDPHWRAAKPPAPFEAFMKLWRNFVPAERGAA